MGERPREHDCVIIDISVNKEFDSLGIEMSWNVDVKFDMFTCSYMDGILNNPSLSTAKRV